MPPRVSYWKDYIRFQLASTPLFAAPINTPSPLNIVLASSATADLSQSIFKQWAQVFYEAGDKIGRTFRFSLEGLQKYAQDAGFENITARKYKLPHGTWPRDKRLKEMGMYVALYMDLSLDGFAIYPIGQILGWSLEEVQALVAKMRAAVLNPRNRTNSDM